LRQLVQLPIATESLGGKLAGSSSVLPEAGAATKSKRQQPKGLRMRYRPSGYGADNSGTLGASDSDEPRQPHTQFRAPPELNGHSKHHKKRKEREEGAANDASEMAHKTKKKRKHKEGRVEEDTVMEDVVRQESGPQSNGLPKKKKDREHNVLSTVNNVHHEKAGETEKSRKKDKEKKKKKREKENA
jgi:hypothetical protein